MDAADESKMEQFPNVVIDGPRVIAAKTVKTAEELHSLCKHLQAHNRLSEVILSSNYITQEGLQYVCELIESCRWITFLDLSMNAFDGHCFSMLSSSIAKSSVTSLVLDDTLCLSNDFVSELSALGKSPALTSLSLRRNALDDEGFRRLLFFFRNSKQLSTIDAAYNNISGKSLPILADFLENALSIKHIDISGLPMDPERGRSFHRLAELAECNIFVTVDDTEDRDLAKRSVVTRQLCVVLTVFVRQFHQSGKMNMSAMLAPSFTLSTEEEASLSDLIAFPSVLAASLRMIEEYIIKLPYQDDPNDIDAVLLLSLQNLSLLVDSFDLQPNLNLPGDTYSLKLPSKFYNTVGRLERCGQVRVQLASFCATLMHTRHPAVLQAMITCNVPQRLLILFLRFPWNSALHGNCVAYFSYCFEWNNSVLITFLINENAFVDIIINALRNAEETRRTEKCEYVGYMGALTQLCELLIAYANTDPEVQTLIGKLDAWKSFMNGFYVTLLKREDAYSSLQRKS